jgi:hypothetical protein
MPQLFARWMPKPSLCQTGSRISKATDRSLVRVAYPLNDATGLVITLLNELRRRKKKYGLATACIGGGQGIAMVVESFH